MADFVRVIEEKNRMCRTSGILCVNCPLNQQEESCEQYVLWYPKEAEIAIMKWAEENPIKTNADKFKEVFGFEPDKTQCPYTNKSGCKHINCFNGCNGCPLNGFWDKEYRRGE